MQCEIKTHSYVPLCDRSSLLRGTHTVADALRPFHRVTSCACSVKLTTANAEVKKVQEFFTRRLVLCGIFAAAIAIPNMASARRLRGGLASRGALRGGRQAMTREELSNCVELERQLDAEEAELDPYLAELRDYQRQIRESNAQLIAGRGRLTTARFRMDDSDQALIAAHNADVEAHNDLVEIYNKLVVEYDKKIAAFNRKVAQFDTACSGRPYLQRDLDAVLSARDRHAD